MVLALRKEIADRLELGLDAPGCAASARLRRLRRGARKALAMKPVKTLKSATPAVNRKTPMIRPHGVTGYWSPYPTVVIVT